MTLFTIIEILGTLAFAISGIRLASAKQFDWFGAYVVGFTTAVGGGTLRDLMLSVTPFWMLNSSYLVVTAAARLVKRTRSRSLTAPTTTQRSEARLMAV